ncbi:MAG TPA: exosortase/archaeosortase family protein [Verrucomicrobiae bacterium]|jgi:exosortase
MNGNPKSEGTQDYWLDTVECWHRLPNKALFFGLLAAWLALFQFYGNSILGYIHSPSLFRILYSAYNDPNADDSHGLLIPFLVVGLYWGKRKELLALPLKIWWPGMLIFMGALLLHIFSFLIQQQLFSIVALFLGIFGLMGLAWGPAWLRHGFFPFWLFIFSFPLGAHGQMITFPLQQLVSWMTEQCAHLLGVNVIRVGTILYDPSGNYAYEVAAACSGIRSLVAIFLLATVYGFVFFRSPWKRALLMVLAAPFSILGNLLRMLMIILTASMGGRDAGNFVHENFFTSLVPYVPAIAGFLLIGRWMEKREQQKANK